MNNTKVKEELTKWINNTYKPNYLMTIQLPENLKSNNIDYSTNHLQKIMQCFERNLLKRHWNKKHLPFIAFAENGISKDWHFHLLLNSQDFTDIELDIAVLKTILELDLSTYCIRLDKIEDGIAKVESYTLKEIKIKDFSKFDSSKIITSHNLFDISVK